MTPGISGTGGSGPGGGGPCGPGGTGTAAWGRPPAGSRAGVRGGRDAHTVVGAHLLREERWARMAIGRIVEPGTHLVHEAVQADGPQATVRRLVEGSLVPPDGGDGYAERVRGLDVEQAVHALDVVGVRVIIPGDEEWPAGLDVLAAPPPCLYAMGRGHLAELAERSVAVVGARACTDYGTHVTHEIVSGLVARGLTIVSGAAFGIDAAAHWATLGCEGDTVAVLACGLDRPYPAAHRRLLHEVARTGVVVGEIPIGYAPFRSRFLARNRLIATMSLGTVVVEASLRSGSLRTATDAATHHRHVMAVPGPVTSMTSAGCHDLIRNKGATLVCDASDVIELVGRLGIDLAEPRRGPVTADAELDAEAYAVWSALPLRRPVAPGVLSSMTTLGLARVLGVLARLEIEGLAVRGDDGWRKVIPRTRDESVRAAGGAAAGGAAAGGAAAGGAAGGAS